MGLKTISPGKGKKLLSAIKELNCEHHSSRKPTNFLTDARKISDLLDFFYQKESNQIISM